MSGVDPFGVMSEGFEMRGFFDGGGGGGLSPFVLRLFTPVFEFWLVLSAPDVVPPVPDAAFAAKSEEKVRCAIPIPKTSLQKMHNIPFPMHVCHLRSVFGLCWLRFDCCAGVCYCWSSM